ncbi:MAG: SgcJ/EcaC family oxidoreductase [Anaerolineales bacterium]
MTIMPTVSPPESSLKDVDTLVERVAELERTQQQEDVQGFLELFDPLAVWVTGGGKRLIGLDAISDFTRTVLPGAMSDGSVRYVVEHILFISPEVALTGVRQQYVDRDGHPTSAGLPSYVWRRTDGVWRIIAGQNTAAEVPVADGD